MVRQVQPKPHHLYVSTSYIARIAIFTIYCTLCYYHLILKSKGYTVENNHERLYFLSNAYLNIHIASCDYKENGVFHM